MFKTRFISMLVLLMAVTGAWATITVTWNNDDITGSGNSFTKDGVTITAGEIEFSEKNFMGGGTFTTTLGNFTKIEVTTELWMASGTGWSGSTWTGTPASSVSFSGDIVGMGNTKFVFTIEPATVAVTGVTLAPTSATLTLGETETVTLIPTVLPAEATDKSVTWSSSNEAVATVTNGVVTAVAAGEATITATATNGTADTSDDKTATCTVTVAEPTYTVTVKEGTEDATSWTIAPAEATTAGVAAGTEVKATYSGTKHVKSVKAKKKAAAAPALNLTSPAVGQVIGSDGKNYAAGASLPTGVTKVAMIAYVSGSNGLAIALADEGEMNWTTAKSTCEAKTPAFTGGTWKLPTQDEWKQMFSANGGDEESCSGLNTAIVNAGGEALQEEVDQYWSSSEEDEDLAWYVRLSDGDTLWDNYDKSGDFHVRACLAF